MYSQVSAPSIPWTKKESTMARVRIVMLVGLLLAVAGVMRAQEAAPAAPAGTWKVLLPTLKGAPDKPVLLVKLEKVKDEWKGEVVQSLLTEKKGSIEKVKVTDKNLTFTIKTTNFGLQFDMKLGEAKATKLYGEAASGKVIFAVDME